jgi:hypothetical protein
LSSSDTWNREFAIAVGIVWAVAAVAASPRIAREANHFLMLRILQREQDKGLGTGLVSG